MKIRIPRINSNSISKTYVISMLMIPILSLYSIGLGTFTLGDVFLVICFLMFAVNEIKRIKIHVPLLILIVFVFFQGILIFGINNYNNSLLRTFRYVLYLAAILISINVKLETKWIRDKYIGICFFATIIMYIQTFSYRVFDIIIPGVIPFVPLLEKEMYDYRWMVIYQNSQRCMSVFEEPSHYAVYILPAILILLLDNRMQKKKKWFMVAFLSLGIVMSASFTGILGLIAAIGIWLVMCFKEGKISPTVLCGVFFTIIIVTVFIMTSSVGSYVLNPKIIVSQGSGRFAGYGYLMKLNDGIVKLFWGHGMNDIAALTYLPGWPRLLFYYGIVGLCIYIIAFWKQSLGNRISKSILLLLAAVSVGSEIAFGSFCLTYMILVGAYSRDEISVISTMALS